MIDLNTLVKQTKTLSLLYVEDNTETCLETIETLSIFFDKIIVAVDGQDGIEKFSEEEFDLIITDINMPNLDGIEMIKKIRDLDLNIPIVIISAHDEAIYFTRTIKLGIEAYLLKPFIAEDLIMIIQKVTDHIFIKQELNEYKISLEKKVKEQVEKLNRQNSFIVHQARLASMGEMINGIAHQWRQPLNRINSCVAVLGSISDASMDSSEMMSSKLKSIEQNTKYMSNTIEDFANFFHPNKEETKFTLQDAVKKSLSLIVSRTKNIDIVINANEEINISTFENEYQQVLLTVLHNAIDNFELKSAMNPRIDIVLKMNNMNPYLCIQDNGGGIDNKDIERIFEPYYTTKFSAEGTGLGLYMAKMIVESSMGGYLRVQNKNSGACFTIEIPQGDTNA